MLLRGSLFGRLPEVGDRIDAPPYRVEVLDISKRRVARVRFELLEDIEPTDEPPSAGEE